MRILKAYNIDIENYDDIGVMSYLLDNGKISHSFSSIIKYHLFNNTEIEINDIEKNNSYIDQYEKDKNLSAISIPDVFNFSCTKIEIMIVIFNIINTRLQKNTELKKLYDEVEKPLIKILMNMEFEGITIDINELKNLSDYFYTELKNLEREIYIAAKLEFNINSPKQLSEVLFEKLNLPTIKKPTKSGNYSTDVDILEDLYSKGYEIAGKVLEYRHYMKLKNTYTDVLPRLIDKNNRIHTNYSNIYVITGRLSSSNPNLQNIPIRTKDGEKIRRTFISKKGYSLIGADYSQIELRILAQYANVKKLIENFENNLDIHTETAKFVFRTNKVTSEMRRSAKAINFSIIYGTTSFGLAKRLDMTNRDAKTYMENYFAMYPEVMEYMEKTKNFVKQNGYVKTMFNRICYINLNDIKEPQKSFLERLAINAPIQGTGADIIKMAMIAVNERIKNYNAKIIMQIHDELLIEVKDECLEEVKAIVKDAMENIVKFKIPLPVEIACGSNWGDAH
jgi:DNA polymerase-1